MSKTDEMLQRLRDAGGSDWDKVENVQEALNEIRGYIAGEETKQVLQRLHDQIAERMRERNQKADDTEDDCFAITYRGQVLGLLDALNMVKEAMKETGNGQRS